jgi:hypothetical protein
MHGAQPASSALHVQAQNFARLAVREDFHRAAADFAISGEPVCSRAGVHDDFKALAAVGAIDFFGNFHGDKLGFAAGVGKCGATKVYGPKFLVFTNRRAVLAFFQMTHDSSQARIRCWQKLMPAGVEFCFGRPSQFTPTAVKGEKL